ncbi:MAG: hypothetical protein ABI877_11615, partial [Gemmatimonadaceae bacterium]
TDRADCSYRQPEHPCEQDHAPTEHPDDAGENEVGIVEVERPCESEDGELAQDEPRAANREEACEFTASRNAPACVLSPLRSTRSAAQSRLGGTR